MKNLLFIILLISKVSFGQVFIVKATAGDQTSYVQSAFNDPSVFTVVISGKVMLGGNLQIPASKILRFEAGGMLYGNGQVKGGIIDASYHQQIFDTSLTVDPQAVNQYFSAKWFGAKGANTDDYAAIQHSINTCIRNNIRTLFLPAGRYSISQPLILRAANVSPGNDKERWFCTLEIVGESSFWDSNMGSEIIPSFNNSFAMGIQAGKGCKIRKLKIIGQFKPPFTSEPKRFFNSSFQEFTDGICRDSRNSPYAAIVIDPFTNTENNKMPADGGYPGLSNYYGKANNLSPTSGSTATELEELSITGFVVGICSSPNGVTQNAEITIINKVQFENCKLAISGGQDQEKGNVITNIHCWGGTHTIFATGQYGRVRQAGNWNIDHVNIAGSVVRFIDNDQHGYFPTYISHVFAESLGSWGTINSELACAISDCHIDFAYPEQAGDLTLLTSWGKNVVYRNCNFRYYGTKIPLRMEGNCVFENCYFSGELKNGNLFLIKAAIYKQPLSLLLITTVVILTLVCAVLAYRLVRMKMKLKS